MRLDFGALPWEMLGKRPVMVTLTYPGDWQQWVPDARTLVRHREALKERWRRKYGMPVGVWVVEFQKRGAPHLHMYLALPDSVSDQEYAGLQHRTTRRRNLERRYGSYEARRRMRAPSGEFGNWIRTAWWEIVGSKSKAHHGRGVDLAVMFFSDKAEETADRVRVAEYLWRESGKWAQKQPPEDFGSLKFYGRWGDKLGFKPRLTEDQVDEQVGYEIRRVMRKLQTVKRRQDAERRGYKFRPELGGTRGRDGLTVFDVDGRKLSPVLRSWAEDVVAWKAVHFGPKPEPEWHWRSVRDPSLRAFNEFDSGGEDEDDGYEAWLEHQAREEAALEAAIERYEAERNGWYEDWW